MPVGCRGLLIAYWVRSGALEGQRWKTLRRAEGGAPTVARAATVAVILGQNPRRAVGAWGLAPPVQARPRPYQPAERSLANPSVSVAGAWGLVSTWTSWAGLARAGASAGADSAGAVAGGA
jgi:hypothetical protein